MITRTTRLPLPVRLALRELRGGLAGFRVFIACLLLGVAAIAAVGSLTRAIEDSLSREGRAILGGDVEIRLFQREMTAQQTEQLSALGELSVSARLRTMARVADSGESTLVELRAVDTLYPLYGTLETRPQLPTGDLLETRGELYGVAIDPTLADRLGVGIGDILQFGSIRADVRALIEREPDKANQGFQLGPSVLIRRDALERSGLVTAGSLVNHYYKLRLPDSQQVKPVREAATDILKQEYNDESWRLRDRTNSAPGLRRFIDQMGSFLVIVGLAALVTGGVGVGNAVKGYMDRKTRTIATLKILGASGQVIFATYFTQVMLIGIAATALGLVAGAFLPTFLAQFLPSSVPVEVQVGLYPDALALSAAYGLLITVAFTAWPLGKARDLPAVRLFRALVAPEKGRPRGSYLVMILIAALIVAALAVGLATNAVLAGGFIVGAGAAFLLLRLTSWLIERGAARMPRPRRPLVRMAVANLHRPGAATGAVVISLGLGLTLFATLALIEGNLSGQLGEQIPDEAPAFFFVDIQPGQLDAFKETARSIEGTRDLVTVPSMRGTITRLNDVASSDWEVPDSEYRWILRGDRGISYGREPGAGSTVVEGDWWPENYSGPPQISFGRAEAEGLGLGIGDTLTVNVLGRDIEAEIVSLRDINWGTFGFNFVLLFDPATLKGAPHTYMATLKADGEAEAAAHRRLTTDFPGVTAVRIKDVLSSVNGLLDQVSSAVTSTALVAIIAGVLVLAGAIAAGFQQRVYESVILKVVGAVRSQVMASYALEFLMIGLIVAFVALGLGALAGYVVVDQVLEIDFRLLPRPMVITVAVALGVTITFGLASSWRALSAKPNSVLRTE